MIGDAGLPLETRTAFYPRYIKESIVKLWCYWKVHLACKKILDEVLAAPDRWTYSDLAISPPLASEFETLDLYQSTDGGKTALERKRRDDAIRAHTTVAAAHLETAPS